LRFSKRSKQKNATSTFLDPLLSSKSCTYLARRGEALEAKIATSAFLDPFFQQQVLIFHRMAQKLLFALS